MEAKTKWRNGIIYSIISVFFFLLLILACEPLVYDFDNMENAEYYTAGQLSVLPDNPQYIRVVTWNIRFGAGRITWFGDGCGKRVILTENEVEANLQRIVHEIDQMRADVLLLQEVDIESKRSAYLDQVQWLLDHTQMNYGVYASAWHAQFIPSDGLGRMNMGTAILSRWPLVNAKRIALPLRGDQDALTQYFYLRRNMLKAKMELPEVDNLYLVNVHTSAFSVDDTKQKHINRFVEELANLDDQGILFIAGGDLNTLPPGSDSTDFCIEDMCPGESFHRAGDDPFHKEGSNYTGEQTWLNDLYNRFQSAVPLQQYQKDQAAYFTHTTIHPNGIWDRKLDYLFSNVFFGDSLFVEDSTITHKQATACSDHAPVSALWRVPK